jgi:hypothetical protein
MLDQFPPKVSGRMPFWRPKPAPVHKDVREPAWSWRAPLVEIPRQNGTHTPSWGVQPTVPLLLAGDHVLTLDANAAYLTAASSVDLAHGALRRTRAIRFDKRLTGYWQIKAHPWLIPWIMSPLGTATIPDRVWLTTPTVALLDQLSDDGYWPGVEVLDSWTCPTSCRLRTWTQQVNSDRKTALARREDFPELYEEIKTGYSTAVTMIGTGKQSLCYRPDWSQSIRAQHAANTWRRAWKAIGRGCPILAAGTVDELTVPLPAYRELQEEHLLIPNPIPLDKTGRLLGTYKIKTAALATDWMTS